MNIFICIIYWLFVVADEYVLYIYYIQLYYFSFIYQVYGMYNTWVLFGDITYYKHGKNIYLHLYIIYLIYFIFIVHNYYIQHNLKINGDGVNYRFFVIKLGRCKIQNLLNYFLYQTVTIFLHIVYIAVGHLEKIKKNQDFYI